VLDHLLKLARRRSLKSSPAIFTPRAKAGHSAESACVSRSADAQEALSVPNNHERGEDEDTSLVSADDDREGHGLEDADEDGDCGSSGEVGDAADSGDEEYMYNSDEERDVETVAGDWMREHVLKRKWAAKEECLRAQLAAGEDKATSLTERTAGGLRNSAPVNIFSGAASSKVTPSSPPPPPPLPPSILYCYYSYILAG